MVVKSPIGRSKCVVSVLVIISTLFVLQLQLHLESGLSLNFQPLTWVRFGQRWPEILVSTMEQSKYLKRNDTRKYVANGSTINCQQQPLNTNGTNNADLFYHPGPGENASFAYVWYISQPHYLCSALVSLKRLKSMRSKTSFPYPVDYVMVYTAEDPLDSPSDHLVKKWEAEGGKRVEFPSLKKHIANAYYRTSLQKFYAFQLIQYSRVVAMDADGVALNNLDHLFLLKFPENVSIAAPQGYWFQNEGVFAGNGDNCKGVVFPVITTILLVVEPSLELFQRVRPYFGQRRPESHQEFFDMDIIQKEFNCLHNEVFVLPKMYGTLDSDFYPNYTILNNYRKCLDFSKVQYMHFTHQGKPWTHRSDWSKNQYQLGTHPNASRMFTTWFREAHATCPSLIASI